MAITVDWGNKLVQSTASILDLPAFKDAIRDLEDNPEGVINPVVIKYKRLDIGGGAYFHAVDLINGYQLKFIGAGPFRIVGNLGGTIVDTGVQVERETSAAFSTTSVGGSGYTLDQIAQAVGQRVVGAGFTEDEITRLMAAMLLAKVSGAGTTTERFRNLEDTKDAVVVTADAPGNRTAVALDPS